MRDKSNNKTYSVILYADTVHWALMFSVCMLMKRSYLP